MKKTVAIKFFGSQIKLAAAIGISQPAISKWSENVPELRAFQLERLTGGELKVHVDSASELNPSTRIASLS